jgi:hypothetical protein
VLSAPLDIDLGNPTAQGMDIELHFYDEQIILRHGEHVSFKFDTIPVEKYRKIFGPLEVCFRSRYAKQQLHMYTIDNTIYLENISRTYDYVIEDRFMSFYFNGFRFPTSMASMDAVFGDKIPHRIFQKVKKPKF